MRSFLLVAALAAAPLLNAQRQLLSVKSGVVEFVSDAPLERISATSVSSSGILDVKDRDFIVRIPMRSFKGFNSPLQQEHFHENYVESKLHPNALFEGRIIEAVDLTVPGTYKVRAKGRFTMHGIARERNIPCVIVVGATDVSVQCAFDVPLADHGIRIPRVVHQKLAPTVRVNVDLRLVAGSKK